MEKRSETEKEKMMRRGKQSIGERERKTFYLIKLLFEIRCVKELSQTIDEVLIDFHRCWWWWHRRLMLQVA